MTEKNISDENFDGFQRYFDGKPCQTDIMIFLLRNGHHSHNLLQICRLGQYLDFNKITLYKAISALNSKGWLVYYKKGIGVSKFAHESFVGYQDKLPLEFLNQVRRSLAISQGFDSWFSFMLSNNTGKKRTNRRATTPYEPAPKSWAKSRWLDEDFNDISDLEETEPQASPLSREENLSHFETRYGGLKNTQQLDLRKKGEVKQKRHRFDPQGFPTRSLTAGTTLEKTAHNTNKL